MRGSAVFRTGVAPGGVLAGPWVRDPLWTRARAVPSLDLRFADNKSLVDATTGQNLVTFTRASSGTFVDSAGVLQTAATDEPRFDHDPTTGESLGLLVEESRTNLLLQSEDLLTTWTAIDGLSRTANQVVAPNEFTTADLLASNGTLTGYLEQPNALSNQFVSGTTYSYSVYLKKANTSTCFTLLYGTTFNSGGGNPIATWNLDTGVPAFVNGATGSMTAVGNGWYRCVITDTATQTHTQNQQWLRMVSPNGDVYAWGAQLEVGAFPTSYIPTTTAAATRSADVCSITGSAFSGFYRQDAQTWFGEYAPIYNASATVPANTPHLMQVYTAAAVNNNYGIRGAEANVTQLAIARNPISGVQFPGVVLGFALAGQLRRLAYSINSSELQLAGMGALGILTINNSAALMTTHDILSIGSGTGGAAPQQVNGHLRRLCFWPTRLPNNTLQTLTQ